MSASQVRMEELSRKYATKSDKIRALSKGGYSRSEIAKFLGVRYQFVRNVLVASEHTDRPSRSRPVAREGIRNRVRVKVEAGGRILIPESFRQAMGIEEGKSVLAWLDQGGLRLLAPQVAMRQAQQLADQLISGKKSLADELIAERREESRREDGDG
jgi:bifunctional DNA-binding transcriptional regulator/antitoxin component of YhaV-PrlF toxin-antitoxin module